MINYEVIYDLKYRFYLLGFLFWVFYFWLLVFIFMKKSRVWICVNIWYKIVGIIIFIVIWVGGGYINGIVEVVYDKDLGLVWV